MFHVLEVACSHYHKILLTLVKRAEDNDDPPITAGGMYHKLSDER